MRRKDWRVIVALPDGGQLAPIHYGSRHTALKGAVWYAEHHPRSHVKVQRYDALTGHYIGYTETRGENAR